MKKIFLLTFILPLFFSCLGRDIRGLHSGDGSTSAFGRGDIESSIVFEESPFEPPVKTDTELRMEEMGLVDIGDIPGIIVDLVYATPDNFMGEILYDDLHTAYLVRDAAVKLAKAQTGLENEFPGYKIIVYDAARPMSVQRKMRAVAESTGKQYYVADPARGGGLHNYGAAVDVSIVDDSGLLLDMGTPYDFLGPESNIDKENELILAGKISEVQLSNRLLLRRIMRDAGFRTVTSEWWHFNHCSRTDAMHRYKLLDF